MEPPSSPGAMDDGGKAKDILRKFIMALGSFWGFVGYVIEIRMFCNDTNFMLSFDLSFELYSKFPEPHFATALGYCTGVGLTGVPLGVEIEAI